jgi:hypothetical protein
MTCVPLVALFGSTLFTPSASAQSAPGADQVQAAETEEEEEEEIIV